MGSTKFRHANLRDFAWTQDGKSVVTVGFRAARVWDAETGRRTRGVALKQSMGGLFAISAGAKLGAAALQDSTTIFDPGTGEILATLGGIKESPAQLGFSADGKLVYVGGGRGRVSVWDWKAGKEHQIPWTPPQFGGTDSSFHCHFSPDGKLFVVGVQSSIPLAVFNVANWDKVHDLDCSASTSTFTPDSKQLIVSSYAGNAAGGGGILRVVDVATGKELHKYSTPSHYYSLAVSPDGKVLGCGISDHSCLLNLATGKVLHSLSGHTWGLAFSPEGKTFAASSSGTHVRFWDVATGNERHEQPGNFGSNCVTAVSPDGRLVAAADWMDREIHTWDTTTGKRVSLFPLKGDERYARNLTFSTDGRTLAAGLYQGMVQVWDVESRKEQQAYQLEREQPQVKGATYYYAVQMSADRRRVTTVERVFARPESTRITVWDPATGKPLRDLSYPGERRRSAWSADGDTLALALDMGVALIDLDTCEERARLEGSAPNGVAVVMSPDGRLVATVRDNPAKGPPSVGVYEVATGKSVATIVTSGEFGIARDNRTLFTADDTLLRAWDLATGKEVARRTIPESIRQIVPLAGRRVFTTMADGTGLVWDIAPAAASSTADEKELEACWTDLRADDSAKAYAAVWRLSASPPESIVPFLSRHLRPEQAPNAAKLRQFVADLDSDMFRVRERATKDLEALGHAAAPALQKALAAGPSAETRRRIEQLLARKPAVASQPDHLRRLRAMQVLERIGTPQARGILTDLGAGLPLAPETKEAQAALARTSP